MKIFVNEIIENKEPTQDEIAILNKIINDKKMR